MKRVERRKERNKKIKTHVDEEGRVEEGETFPGCSLSCGRTGACTTWIQVRFLSSSFHIISSFCLFRLWGFSEYHGNLVPAPACDKILSLHITHTHLQQLCLLAQSPLLVQRLHRILQKVLLSCPVSCYLNISTCLVLLKVYFQTFQTLWQIVLFPIFSFTELSIWVGSAYTHCTCTS